MNDKSPARSETKMDAKEKVLAVWADVIVRCEQDRDIFKWRAYRTVGGERTVGLGNSESECWDDIITAYAFAEDAARLSHPVDDELSALVALPDDQIDTSEIPEKTDWSKAKRVRHRVKPKPEEVELCDTTSTPRVAAHWCVCITRTDLMGPCMTWCLGNNGRCSYCDHEFYCHRMLMASQGKAIEPKPEATPAEEIQDRIYPCADCGKMRSKAEGGTVFTVCDTCWDKAHTKPESPQAAQEEEFRKKWPPTNMCCVVYPFEMGEPLICQRAKDHSGAHWAKGEHCEYSWPIESPQAEGAKSEGYKRVPSSPVCAKRGLWPYPCVGRIELQSNGSMKGSFLCEEHASQAVKPSLQSQPSSLALGEATYRQRLNRSHVVACNNPDNAIGGAGCICKVVMRNEPSSLAGSVIDVEELKQLPEVYNAAQKYRWAPMDDQAATRTAYDDLISLIWNAARRQFRPLKWEKEQLEGVGKLHGLCLEMKWGSPGDNLFDVVIAGIRRLVGSQPLKEFVQLLKEIKGEHDRLSHYDRCACWICVRIEDLLSQQQSQPSSTFLTEQDRRRLRRAAHFCDVYMDLRNKKESLPSLKEVEIANDEILRVLGCEQEYLMHPDPEPVIEPQIKDIPNDEMLVQWIRDLRIESAEIVYEKVRDGIGIDVPSMAYKALILKSMKWYAQQFRKAQQEKVK